MIPHLAERLRLRLWVVPAIGAILAAVAALGVIVIAEGGDPLVTWVDVGPVSARYLLSAIASAMITFTALVFSVTMLVLQLAASQLSPRVMRTFLRDRFNQVVLALFVATFVFALLLLVSIDEAGVPQLGIFVAIVLVLISVLAFVTYIDHMAHAVGASDVIDSIGQETRQVIDRLYPDDADAASDPEGAAVADSDQPRSDAQASDLPTEIRTVRLAHPSGYVVVIDEEHIARVAARNDVTVEVLAAVGTFVTTDEPLFAIRDGGDAPHDLRLQDLIEGLTLASERTMSQDPTFGLRQLIDIALRALSSGMNDHTTANQVIDHLHDLLLLLRDRPLRSPRRVHLDGELRALIPALEWDGLVLSTTGELAHASREQPYVREHLRTMLRRLEDGAPSERVAAVRRALRLLDSGTADTFGQATDAGVSISSSP